MAKVSVKPASKPFMSPEHPDDSCLRVFRTLDIEIMKMTEEQCWNLLELEKAGKSRRLFLQRIYGRASTLRAQRETKELRGCFSDL